MMGDPVIAKMYKGRPAPVEKIVGTDYLATALNRDKIGRDVRKRVVDLACGHKTVTKNRTKAPCQECRRMMLDGEDYEAFRRQRGLSTFDDSGKDPAHDR